MTQSRRKGIADVTAYLDGQAAKPALRFLTCGSVDDGKSTLIGRLLYDAKVILEDQLATLALDSKKQGTTGDGLDFSLLVDGLAAEREQGITIDVAYRYFATDKRRFVVADTPGHEQYTRNMASGASHCELAVVLVDARKGVLTQTRRHSYIAHMFGIRHFVLAVNKMDLVGFDEAVFTAIEGDYQGFLNQLGDPTLAAIPISARTGEMIATVGEAMPWYKGPALLSYLETAEVTPASDGGAFRLPVQWVNRPNAGFRGFSGTVAQGSVRPGDAVLALPSGQHSQVKQVVILDGELEVAEAGRAITLTLADEIDVSRGDVLCCPDHPAQTSDQLVVHLLWMSEDELIPGRQYRLKCATRTVNCVVTELKYAVNVNTLETLASHTLGLNSIGVANVSLSERIVFEPFAQSQALGGIILIDRRSNATVGVGTFDFSLRRADNVIWQELTIDKAHRAALKQQKPCMIWLTGLSGSGKSTIANLLESRLHDLHRHTYTLDGDNVRHGLTRDLGFTEVDRVENVRRIGETAKLMVDAGLIAIVAFISPYRSDRRMVRGLLAKGEFIEVFVDAPMDVCEVRDPKGLYKKARHGQIVNFTGIGAVYEPPEQPEVILDTEAMTAEQSVEKVLDYLRQALLLD